MPVGLAKSGIFTHFRHVAVFNPIAHGLCRPRSGIGADIGFAIQLPAQSNELVRAKRIGFFYAPCLIKHGGTVSANALFPIIRGYKAAAGPPDDRRANLAKRV